MELVFQKYAEFLYDTVVMYPYKHNSEVGQQCWRILLRNILYSIVQITSGASIFAKIFPTQKGEIARKYLVMYKKQPFVIL